MVKCESCKNLRYEGVSQDNAYPSFWCSKGHWDSLPKTADLSIEIKCEDYE